MLVQTLPDTMTKLTLLSEATQFEPAGDQPQQERRHAAYQSRSLAQCITNVSTPRGKLPILKTMLTTIPLRLNKGFYTLGRSSVTILCRSNSIHHSLFAPF